MTKHRFLVARQIGAEPFSYTRTCLDTSLVERLRSTSLDDMTDLDAAYELTRLAMVDLEAFGTGGGEILDLSGCNRRGCRCGDSCGHERQLNARGGRRGEGGSRRRGRGA
ncbi:hypothetical protein ACFYNL_39295 [Streptomyces sp. NPDC007808]|uniref:hypothetical protein n=1 Tax=Streptomyces sp. NPDC007808 TaxID=3364779 RepID=UPI00368220AA